MEAAADIYRKLIFPGGPEMDALFERSMLDATVDCIKLISLDGTLLKMNRAGCVAFGVEDDGVFGMAWLPLLPLAVQTAGEQALSLARHGQSARFAGQSYSQDGLRYWDNLLTPIKDAAGFVYSILCVARDVTSNRRLEQELDAAVQRERLLSHEMKHRMKNMFSVVSGLITLAEREAALKGEPLDASRILRGKVSALSRASEAVFSTSPMEVEEKALDIGTLVNAVLEPYGESYEASGPQATICRGTMTTLVLFLHELATNSIKYGSFSYDRGTVHVSWETAISRLRLTWVESGGPPIEENPGRVGFGSEMIDRLVKSVGGTVERKWSRDGLTAVLVLPAAETSAEA